MLLSFILFYMKMEVSKTLIAACLKNDRVAQKQLYSSLLPYLRAICKRYLKNQAFTKDVLQEAFINIFKNIASFDPYKGRFNKWAVRITINCALKYNQRIVTDQDEFQPDKHDIPFVKADPKNISDDDLLAILKKMPQRSYQVLNLFVIEEYSHKEIAALLNINEATSRKIYSRSKLWLSEAFISNDQLVKRYSLKKVK